MSQMAGGAGTSLLPVRSNPEPLVQLYATQARLSLLVAVGVLKHKVKNALQFITDFEQAVSAEAARCKVNGIVCGYIHKAEIREIDGVLYCNDGDWVEGCTALAEAPEGRLEIVHWAYLIFFPHAG